MLRLGDDVARDGRISARHRRPRGRERRAASASSPTRSGAQEVIAKATSAIRTAANGSELVDRIEAETGVEVEVINGLEEARLIFARGPGQRRARARARAVHRHRRRQRRDHDRRRRRPALGDERAASASAGSPPSSCTPTRRRRATATRSTSTSATCSRRVADEVARVAAARWRSARSGTINDLAAHGRRVPDRRRSPRARNRLARRRRADLRALHERIMRMPRSSERRRLPGHRGEARRAPRRRRRRCSRHDLRRVRRSSR